MNKQEVIEIRKKLHFYSNYIGKAYPSREMSLVITHLQKSRMWLGKFLSLFPDSESPYAINDGKRNSKKDILPTADKSSLDPSIPIENSIKEIDELREWLEKEYDYFNDNWYKIFNSKSNSILKKVIEFDLKVQTIVINIMYNMIESRMWLGEVLRVIKEKDE